MKTRISGTPSLDGSLCLAGTSSDVHGGPGLGRTADALRGHVLTDRLMSEGTMSGRMRPPAPLDPASLPAGVRDHLGVHLRGAYEALTRAQTPQRLLDLVAQLDAALEG